MFPSYDENNVRNAPYDDTRPFPKAPELGGQSTVSHDNILSLSHGGLGQWTTGFFDCLHDPTNCLVTAFFPCYTFGRIADIVDKGDPGCAVSGSIQLAISMAFPPIHWLYPFIIRSKLRKQYGIEADPICDFLVHFFCGLCALCQEYRELKTRGFDMELGWRANMERQNPGAMMPPSVGPMTR
ncbi:hypothetical protein vseg_019397 [Gypsophila vaccaria]